MAEQLRQRVAQIVNGLERYNPENLEILEKYVTVSAAENFYDLEAYLAVLKLYQFRPMLFNQEITIIILLKAITNLPHSDFTLCKCIFDLPKAAQYDDTFIKITQLWEMLETCQFDLFWSNIKVISDKVLAINGFEDSIRKFICHVVAITYQVIKKSDLKNLLGNITESETNQWITTNKWKDMGDGYIYVANQEDFIKTRNITEKIDFNAVADVMRLSAK